MNSKPTDGVAIVTGASRGFGRAVTMDLLREGWTVIGDGRDQNTLRELCVDASSISADLNVLPGDISDSEHLEELVRNANRYGTLKLVVNNAGSLGPAPLPALAEIEPDAFLELLAVNMVAQLRLIQIAIESMSLGGSFVSVSSDAAVGAYEGWGAYGASKAGLDQTMAVLAAENPKFKWFALDPGDMRTEMHQAAFPGEDISDRPLPEVSAPAVLKLTMGEFESGRYTAAELLGQT